MDKIYDVPSEDKAWLEKVGQVAKTEKPKPTTKKDEEQSMAVFLNNKVGVKVNSVDLSDHVSAVTINRNNQER